jgi:hypothetical protein
MWKFEKTNLSEPAVQLAEYSHIPDLCKNIDNLLGLLYTMNPIPDDAKWVVSSLLSDAKSGLTSMTDYIHRLKKENEELNRRSHLDQSEFQKCLQLELDNQRQQNIILQKTTSLLMASQTQLKKDMTALFHSKDQRIAELEKEIASQEKSSTTSKVVGYERNNPRPTSPHESQNEAVSCPIISKSLPERKPEAKSKDFEFEKPIPDAVETRKNNMRKPEPIQTVTKLDAASPFSKFEPERIPDDDFCVISDDIEETEYKNKIILWNILTRDYGRVVGRGGKNIERLEDEYGVKISLIDLKKETAKLIISGGDAESRRAASNDIIKNLPVIVECTQIENLNTRMMKDVSFQCDVKINKPDDDSDYVTICGRMENCRLAYKKLKESNSKLWYPK